MAEKDTSKLLIFTGNGCSDRMAQWLKAALSSLEEVLDARSNPRLATSFFFSFIVFLPFGFLLFILAADPFSFARFLRKRISSYRLLSLKLIIGLSIDYAWNKS